MFTAHPRRTFQLIWTEQLNTKTECNHFRLCFQTTKENIKKLPKMTEQHSKDEKERKGTKKKTSKGSADCKSWPRRARELCAGLRLLHPMARSPIVRSLIRESVRSIHREIYIQRNIRHLRKATGYNTRLPSKRKMHHFKMQSTQLHPELGLKSIKNGGPRLKTHFQKIMIRGSSN